MASTHETESYESDDDFTWYLVGFWITAVITFIGSWIYAVVNYGFLLGVGLGWIPSGIVAVIVGGLWPLIALALGALLLFAFL